MPKSTKPTSPPAPDQADELATGLLPTDESVNYAELNDYDEIVILVGERSTIRKNKVIKIAAEHFSIMTKAGWQAMDRDEAGDLVHLSDAYPVGTPKYEKVRDQTAAGGYRTDVIVIPFLDIDELMADRSTDEDELSA